MERTSPKRIRIDAAVLEAQKVHEQLILAEGLAERAQVSVKEEKSRAEGLHKELKLVSRKLQIGKKSSAEGFHKEMLQCALMFITVLCSLFVLCSLSVANRTTVGSHQELK
jgi:hypothetical protein